MLEAYLAIVFIGIAFMGLVLLMELIWIVLVEDLDDGRTEDDNAADRRY